MRQQNDLFIRAAGPADLPSLLDLYRQLNPEDPPVSPQAAERIWRDFSAGAGNTILAGLLDGAIVTSCTLVVISNLTRGGAPYALIENVVTDARHRRRGYGRAVLADAISEAWRLGCYKVMLLTGAKDPATLSFYESAGLEQTKTGYQVRRLPARQS